MNFEKMHAIDKDRDRVYAQWVHNHTFVAAVVRQGAVDEVHAGPFRWWKD